MSPPVKKSKKSHYNKYNKQKNVVEAGQRGFLATCNFQEKRCIRECLNLLSHYGNLLYGAENEADTKISNDDDPEVDISDALSHDINVAQLEKTKTKKARFRALETGAINTVFICTTLHDPVELGSHIVTDIYNNGSNETRTLIRLIPIEVVCSASNEQAIFNAVNDIFEKHFAREPACSYSIAVNRRLNNSIDRDTLIRGLAGAVFNKNPIHKVDLRNPDKTIVVEIMKGICMIGVLPGYFKYRKYNLFECGRAREEANNKEKEKTAEEESKVEEVDNSATVESHSQSVEAAEETVVEKPADSA